MRGSVNLTRQLAAEKVREATLATQKRELAARAMIEARFAQGAELTIAREKVITAQRELALSLKNPALINKIASERARLAAISQAQVQVEERALAAANRKLGLTARASDVRTAAITTVPSGPGTNLRNDPERLASLNQQIARAMAQNSGPSTSNFRQRRLNWPRCGRTLPW